MNKIIIVYSIILRIYHYFVILWAVMLFSSTRQNDNSLRVKKWQFTHTHIVLMNKSFHRKLRWMMQSVYDWINRGNYTSIHSSYFTRQIRYQNQRTTCCIYISIFPLPTYLSVLVLNNMLFLDALCYCGTLGFSASMYMGNGWINVSEKTFIQEWQNVKEHNLCLGMFVCLS